MDNPRANTLQRVTWCLLLGQAVASNLMEAGYTRAEAQQMGEVYMTDPQHEIALLDALERVQMVWSANPPARRVVSAVRQIAAISLDLAEQIAKTERQAPHE